MLAHVYTSLVTYTKYETFMFLLNTITKGRKKNKNKELMRRTLWYVHLFIPYLVILHAVQHFQ